MKLLLLAILIASILAVTPTKGDEIVKQLEGIELDGEIFVIMFFDPQCCAEPKKGINEKVKKEITDKVLSTPEGEDYIFYEVDTSDLDMKSVIDLLEIDEYQTKHGPTVLIASSGTGYWAHGDDAADKIAKKTKQFQTIKEDAMKKIAKRDELIN